MARAEIDLVVTTVSSSTGRLSAGSNATVNVFNRNTDGTNGSAASIFTTPNLGTTASNPLTTDASGRITGWLDQGSYNLVVSGTGITTYTQPFESMPATNVTPGAGTVGSTQLASNAVTTSAIGANQVTLAKLASDATTDYGYSYSIYKYATSHWGQIASAATAGTYVMIEGGGPVLATATNAGTGLFYLDPADFAAGSRSVLGRIRIVVATNATAPTINFTAGLYPVTAVAGASGTNSITLGTVTTGSTAAVNTPAATSMTQISSSDFTIPTAGFYALAIVTSGTNATGATTAVHVSYRIHEV